MPPKSNKRAKTAPAQSYTANVEPPLVAISTIPDTCTTPSTRKGFLALPNELIHEIISYYPSITTEHCLMSLGRYINDHKNSPDFFQRFNILRALSQTCRYLRQIYLPLLWERFQVSLSIKTQWYWHRELGEAMERKSRGLLASKHLWPYVRVVTVTLTRFQPKKVFPPFVELLRALPNVHTLEIRSASSEMTIRKAFEDSIFPTIEKVLLPTCAHEILRCCPSVREVTCREGDGGRLVSALVRGGCRKLEVLRGTAPEPALMQRLSKEYPPLKSIRITTKLGWPETASSIEACSAFPLLRVIEIDWYPAKPDGNISQLVKLATDALHACANYKPPKQTRKSTNGTGGLTSGLPSTYPDSRVVRVRHLPAGYPYFDQSAFHHVPERVEEFQADS